MKNIVHKASTRGNADYGWLQANYSFSFANYFDTERTQFGALRVLNDDFISPSMGFGKHPHDNMEIVTIPLQGTLKHEDNMNNKVVLHPGEVQVMSAGKGIQHSELNDSATETTNILQLWVLPEQQDVRSRYEQKYFEEKDKENKFLTVVSPQDKNDGKALWIYQQAYFNLGNFSAGSEAQYALREPTHGVYFFVIDGEVELADETLSKRDAMGIWDTESISFRVIKDAKVLVVEVPMN